MDSRRAASTKTRIETPSHPSDTSHISGRRAASTKTRIETYIVREFLYIFYIVAGRHPLKQGLKRWVQQRPQPEHLVAGRHPLKQGLKPWKTNNIPPRIICRRAASTKTRIETCLQYPAQLFCIMCRRAASTKTRIETRDNRIYIIHRYIVAGRHPLKQGLKPRIKR